MTSVAGGLTFTPVCVKSLWNRLNKFRELLPTSAVISSPFAGLLFCQIEPVLLDGSGACAVRLVETEHGLSNCEALKVTMFVM